MPRGEYIVLTLIGSTIWNALLIGAGYLLGAQWERVSDAIGRLSTPVLIIAGLAVAVLVVRRVAARPPAIRGRWRCRYGAATISRFILVGLEVLIVADIVRTIIVEPTLESVAVLGASS